MSARLPTVAPVFTVAVTVQHVELWVTTLGQASAIDWCATNGVWLYELLAGRVWVHGWAGGHRLIQIEERRRLPGRVLEHRSSLPERVGHLIRWDRPTTQTAEGGPSCPSPA